MEIILKKSLHKVTSPPLFLKLLCNFDFLKNCVATLSQLFRDGFACPRPQTYEHISRDWAGKDARKNGSRTINIPLARLHQSKAIDLYAQEAKRRAEINNAHSAQENEALKAYKQAIANAELAESEAMGNIELAEDQENEVKRQSYVETLRQALEQNKSGEITDEDFSRYYKEYAQYLGEDDKLLKEDLEAKNAKIEAEKGITSSLHSEPEKTISLNELVANEDALGKFAKGTEQTEWINEIISRAQSEEADSLEGKVIDANFGWGSQYYLYKNGYFYKVTKAQAEANGWEIIRKNKETNINLGI